MRARVVPYSSIVGSQVALFDKAGGPEVYLALLNVPGALGDEHRKNSEVYARAVAEAINAHSTRFSVGTLEGS